MTSVRTSSMTCLLAERCSTDYSADNFCFVKKLFVKFEKLFRTKASLRDFSSSLGKVILKSSCLWLLECLQKALLRVFTLFSKKQASETLFANFTQQRKDGKSFELYVVTFLEILFSRKLRKKLLFRSIIMRRHLIVALPNDCRIVPRKHLLEVAYVTSFTFLVSQAGRRGRSEIASRPKGKRKRANKKTLDLYHSIRLFAQPRKAIKINNNYGN